MPLPTPSPNENKDKFISDCMSSEVMKKEFPSQSQRYAVCNRQYTAKKAKASEGEPDWSQCEDENFLKLD